MMEAEMEMTQKKIETLTQMRVLDMHAHLSCVVGNFDSYDTKTLCADAQHNLFYETEKSPDTEALEELELRRNGGVATFFSCGTPGEWEFMKRFRTREELLLSFGIHPWYADRYEADDYAEAFRQCDAVGEIGMDNTWCDVDIAVQRRQFARQLEIAADCKKPVVLHTKGMEREIAGMIRGFPNPVCVHWYSGDRESLELFLEQDCYFTLGPDLAQDCREKYADMLRRIPAERLFVETDGISAVAWALGSGYTGLDKIPQVLYGNMRCLAEWKNRKEEALCRTMWENLRRFLKVSEEST